MGRHAAAERQKRRGDAYCLLGAAVVMAIVFVVALITAVTWFLLGRPLLTGNGFTAAHGCG